MIIMSTKRENHSIGDWCNLPYVISLLNDLENAIRGHSFDSGFETGYYMGYIDGIVKGVSNEH